MLWKISLKIHIGQWSSTPHVTEHYLLGDYFFPFLYIQQQQKNYVMSKVASPVLAPLRSFGRQRMGRRSTGSYITNSATHSRNTPPPICMMGGLLPITPVAKTKTSLACHKWGPGKSSGNQRQGFCSGGSLPFEYPPPLRRGGGLL